MRVPKIRLLVASGARARCVERREDDHELVTVEEFSPPPRRAGHGPVHVSFESAVVGRHGGEAPQTAARQAEDFAQALASRLNTESRRGDFERLGLVAPPRMLRAIREALSADARAKLCFEMAKDLTKQPNHDLRRWLHGPGLI